MYLLVILCSLTLVRGQIDPFPSIVCSRKQPMTLDNLPNQLLPKKNYIITTRSTNWMTNTTSKFVEYFYGIDQTNIITKTDASGQQLWVLNNSTTLFFNGTKCQNETGPINPYNLSSIILDFLDSKGVYISDIIHSIIHRSFDEKALKFTGFTGGVNTLGWLGCSFNATGDNSTGIKVLVSFAGEKSIQSYNPAFKNPLIYNVHFYVFKEDPKNQNHSISEHNSLDFVAVDVADDFHKIQTFLIPEGSYCENIIASNLSFKFPSRFESSFQFIDPNGMTIDSVKMMYDQGNRIVAYSLDFSKDFDVPFIGKASLGETKIEKATIIRDFIHGLQYVLSIDSRVCYQIMPLDVKMGDVDEKLGNFSLKDPNELFFGIKSQEFYYAGKFDSTNLKVDRYVSRKILDNNEEVVIEVDLLPIEWVGHDNKGPLLYSISRYHKNKTNLIKKTIFHMTNFMNTTLIGTSWNRYNIEPCVEGEKDFYYVILNIKIDIIKKIGYENVVSVVKEAIAKAGNVSLLRITYPLFKQYGEKVIALFLIADKSKVLKPTQTIYFENESSVDEVVTNLNKTISTSAIQVSVLSEDLKSTDFLINGFGSLPDHINPPSPSPPSPSASGYSGSSMFIFGLFMFIFGVTGTVGAYFFYWKRRTISGIAYQVFE